MANFYTDNPDLRHHLTHPLMEKIVALKERNYTDAEKIRLCTARLCRCSGQL